MSTVWQLAAVLALILGLLGSMAGLSHLARIRDWHPEVARKIVHVAASGIAIPLPWLFPDDWPVWLLLGLALAAMIAMRTPLLAGPGRALHSVERRSWGDVLLVLSVGLVFLLHEGEPVLYVLPLAVLALGDAAAALTGSSYGRNFYRTPDGRKSLEGSVMFFLVTLILAMICLLLLTGIGRSTLILVAIAIAVFTTVIEADSWHGFDNLFLPMGVFLFLYNIVIETEQATLPGMTIPLAGLVATYGLTRAAGLTPQVSRILAVALFLILSATNAWNAILPSLALAAHAYAASRRGDPQIAADTLNVISGLALVSFGFLALGAIAGVSVINFYGLVCGAIAAAHASRGWPWPGRAGVVAAVAITAVIWGIWHMVSGFNPPEAQWHGAIGPGAAAIVGASALAPVMWPAAFQGAAAIRITLLAAGPSLALCAVSYLFAGQGIS